MIALLLSLGPAGAQSGRSYLSNILCTSKNGELGADEKPAKGNDALDAAPSRNAGQSSRYMCLLVAGGQSPPASAPDGAGMRRPWALPTALLPAKDTLGKCRSIQRQDVGVTGQVV
jgi:hypothetical protein